ncbi:MAG TPA: class I SAM-dependent methyltransferase [Actinomycetes bacterium]|nr:class I SAM-dependent methyltransferase [Actinomycetes bacterium]
MVRRRWAEEGGEEHSRWYIERFRRMAAEGADLGGEARFMDALLPPKSRILDAGCGTGRVAAVLHDRGHKVVGVDADPLLIEAARADHPGPVFIVADLAELDLAESGLELPFAGAVMAGNVMPFLAPGTEVAALSAIARHIEPHGAIVVGFGLDRGYDLDVFDSHLAEAGLVLEQRFATWDLRPWTTTSEFNVSVLRVPDQI